MQINVQGGTNAGWRSPKAQAKDYTCAGCSAKNRYYWTKCPVCNKPRPDVGPSGA